MGRNGDIVKRLYEDLARGDFPAVLATFDQKIEWREADSFLYADGNPYLGPEGVAELVQRIGSDVERFSVTTENIVDGGETVVAEGRYRGMIKATGSPVDAQFAHVWELKEGKIVRFRQYTDTKHWAEAAGS